MNCPNCDQAVSAESDNCPSCGHQFMPVVGGDAIETSRRPGWLVFVGVAAAVLAVGVGAFALTGNAAATAVLADRIPAGASAYVEVDIAQLTSDDMASVIEAFSPIIEEETGEEFSVDRAMEEILASFDEELAELDMSFEEDVSSWAEGPVAVGVFGDPHPDPNAEPDVAMVVSGKDAAALDGFLEKLAREAEGTEEIDGVEFLQIPGEHETKTMLVAQVDDDLVAASTSSLAEAIVSGPADSLAANEEFNAQINALREPGFLLYAVDLDVMAQASESMPGLTGMEGMSAYATGWMAGSVALVDGNIEMASVANTSDDFPFPTADPAVEAALPAETIAFLRMSGLFEQLDLLAATGMLGGMEQAYGLALDDIQSLFGVDGAVAVWPSSDAEIPIDVALVGVGEADGTPVVDKIAALMEMLQYPLETTESGYRFADVGELGTRDTLTFLTTQGHLIRAAPSESFADGDLHRRATDLVGGNLQLAIDVPAVIDIAEGFEAVDDPEAAEKLACLPIGVVAGGAEVDGTTVRASLVIEIAPRC